MIMLRPTTVVSTGKEVPLAMYSVDTKYVVACETVKAAKDLVVDTQLISGKVASVCGRRVSRTDKAVFMVRELVALGNIF